MKTGDESGTSTWVRGLVVGGALAMLATVSAAQERTAAAPLAAAAGDSAAARAEKQPQSGMGEGIKVHGHWTIDIKNPDGTLASHHEFENALWNPPAIAQILGHSASIGTWRVNVLSAPLGAPSGICSSGPGTPAVSFCSIDEGGAFQRVHGYYFAGLEVTVPVSGPNAGKVVLRGTILATYSGSILEVRTQTTLCPASQPPGQACAGTSQDITGRVLATPIPIQADQLADVTVVLSFS